MRDLRLLNTGHKIKGTRKEMKTPLGNKTKVHLLYDPHARKDRWCQCQDCTSAVRDLRWGLNLCLYLATVYSFTQQKRQPAIHQENTFTKPDTSITPAICLHMNYIINRLHTYRYLELNFGHYMHKLATPSLWMQCSPGFSPPLLPPSSQNKKTQQHSLLST